MSHWVEVTSFGDLVVRGARKWPDREAVVFPEKRYTFGSLHAAASRAGRSLLGLGVRPGDHVGILMPNCMDFVEVMFGAALIGAWVVPINARFKERELSYVVENADLKVIVTSDIIDQYIDYVELLYAGFPDLLLAADPIHLKIAKAPKLRSVTLLGDKVVPGMVDRTTFTRLSADFTDDYLESLRRQVLLRDVAMMMYSSGTTADPKGCPITHEGLVRTALMAGSTRFELTDRDIFWDPLPLFHMSAILPLIACLYNGASYVSLTHFEPGAAISQMIEEKATICFSTFPTLTLAMINHPDWEGKNFSRLRMMCNVAAPDLLRKIHAALPHLKHVNAYGCTECGGVIAFSEPDDPPEKRPVTSGRPFPGIQIQIRDPDTGELLDEPHRRGQIWVKGYCLFEGYYKDEEKNSESFRDGWFCPGDLGALDEDGRISYLGRSKDMLKVGGENVSAVEIESFLQTHSSVALAQVVAVPDEKHQEVPGAFIQLVPGAVMEEKEIIEFCKGKISSWKVPRYVRFVTEWPMSGTKVQKFKLQEALMSELGKAPQSRAV